jgi:peptidoglycan/LPS O-acetylase OafA/YrhL
VAVAAVIAFHTGAGWAVGGFLGVDLFFVLSGFLITTLLVGEWQRRAHVSLRRFYARRALRLLPAVLFLCVVLLIAGPVASGAAAEHALWKGVAGTVFYFANWQQALGMLPLFQLTDHTWSLAIEEQFYLIWPPLLVAVFTWSRRRGRDPFRTALTVAGTLIVVALVVRIVLWHAVPAADRLARVYYGTDTRADSLLVGAAFGIAYATGRLHALRTLLSGLAPLALVAIVVFFGFVDRPDAWLNQWGYTVVALTAAVLIAGVALDVTSPLGRVLSLAPLVALGRISYGVYLWHWPLFRYLHQEELGLGWWQTQLVRIAVTLVVATVSYVVVERPLLRLRHRFDPPGINTSQVVTPA